MNARLRKRASQRGGVVRSLILTVVMLAIVAAAAAGGGVLYLRKVTNEPGPLAQDAVVQLAPGMSVSAIGTSLKSANAIRSKRAFVLAVRLRREQGALRAGEYRVPAHASMAEIIDLLKSGEVILHTLTIPEGLTTAQALRIVADDTSLSGELTLAPGEGALLPETYAFPRGENRDALVRRMMTAQASLLDKLWPTRAVDLPFSTREEALTLASIVEKETSVPSERPRIAAVFVNRLRKRMRLESDPTIIYGLTGGEPLGRGLRLSELRSDTPYNTYVIRGLPPTPIANPGRASIEAVLNPAHTDDLFFVADGTGGHVFSASLAEHNRNVAKWRRIERERANDE